MAHIAGLVEMSDRSKNEFVYSTVNQPGASSNNLRTPCYTRQNGKGIRPVTNTDIKTLLEKAKHITMSAGDREAQRKSFAYGNANIENEAVTKAVIDEVAERMIQEPDVDDLTL